MKTVADAFELARSNLIERTKKTSQGQKPYRKSEDAHVLPQKVARIHRGVSLDGVNFALGPHLVISPGEDVPGSYDSGGCEDPTVAYVDGSYYVYYTGWNEHLKRGELLLASGPSLERLEKRGIALPSTPSEINPKEAEIVRADDGSWRLFFEYAHDDRSKIGIASSARVDGPWTVQKPLFESRPGWDEWHLSTGPRHRRRQGYR